ncbi:hypothetical protein CCR75_007127 [Bremia lactucae]|uniref:Uncharacterized protein n=1 Tax=Bremia lactucae TaxID=4779 RepID=A0A976IBK7_BRELC|nr:hypothetical protein CCR75_007127 [Bremia lactucae]
MQQQTFQPVTNQTIPWKDPSSATQAKRNVPWSELTPSEAVHEIVRKIMLARFLNCSIPERTQYLREIQQHSRYFANRLLLSPTDDTFEEKPSSQYILPQERILRPSAYFSFKDNSQMHLPSIDWSAFRGYSVAMWINVAFCTHLIKSHETLNATFYLYRFFNGPPSSMGVEAFIELIQDRVLLTINCGTPKESITSTSIARMTSKAPEWRQSQHEIPFQRNQWHLLVLTHSLPYVKKSKVTCYIDKKLVFSDELVYPSSLVTASKCLIGGGYNTRTNIASVVMYQEDLTHEAIEWIYTLGPMVSSFNRWITPLPRPSTSHRVASMQERRLGPSPFTMPEHAACTAFWKVHVVFAFHAQQIGFEASKDLGFEWKCEGTCSHMNGHWVTLESTVGTCAAIQQYTAQLDTYTTKRMFPDYQTAWSRLVGISSLPVLLEYVLTAYEKTVRVSQSSAFEDGSTRSLGEVMESLVIDFVWLFKGLLLCNRPNQDEVLQQYSFHLFAHVLLRHPDALSVIWTPGSLIVCVEMVKNLAHMIPAPRTNVDGGINHPFHASIWATNPLFATGIHAILLDYRLWSHTDYKTQSIYNHQVYSLACEYPQVFNNLHAVDTVLEILDQFYANALNTLDPLHTRIESSRNSQHFTTKEDKKQHWKQQCIQSLVEVIEVCLTNESSQVQKVLEQEVMETTFARATYPAGPTGSLNPPSSGSKFVVSPPTSLSSFSIDRKGGVFCMNLENIVWSDQEASIHTPDGPVKKSVLNSIQVRFALVRDLRAVIRFLLTSHDAVVCTSLLLLLRRLAVSFLDMRVALVSSSILDCLLSLMSGHRSDEREKEDMTASDAFVSLSVRMACVPLFIYLLHWLESIEGRTIWCGLEEHLRGVLNGQWSFSDGFLELMMEFYFDPAWHLGLYYSIVMNDPCTRDSHLFPMASSTFLNALGTHESSGLDNGIAVGTHSSTSDLSLQSGTFMEWIQVAIRSVGTRLQLTWEKRVSIIRLIALRSLSTVGQNRHAFDATLFDESVRGILSLPLPGVLPFLPLLLGPSTSRFREMVLMDINVKVKTENDVQQQILLLKKHWAEALLNLSLTCSVTVEVDASENDTNDTIEHDNIYGRAYSIDASKTGEDLVLDTIVSLLCMAMTNPHGWDSITHLLLALQSIQVKYQAPESVSSQFSGSVRPHVALFVAQSEIFCDPLTWLCRVIGMVLQRMARSRTILTKTLSENVQRVLFLVHEALLSRPRQPPLVELQRSAFSNAQVFLFNAVLDVCTRLIQSTHQLHRVGLDPGLAIVQHALPYLASTRLMERTMDVLVQSFQQEFTALRVNASIPLRHVFLRALVNLRRALTVHTKDEVIELLQGLTLRIGTSGSFQDELDAAGLSTHELSAQTTHDAVEKVLHALARAINDMEARDRDDNETNDWRPYFPIANELDKRQACRHEETWDTRSTYSSVVSRNDSERVVWAASEVEENRMVALMQDVRNREQQRSLTAKSIQCIEKDPWTHELWLTHELTFRSQHEYKSLRDIAPATLLALHQTHVWRLGGYETPFPSRIRQTIAIDVHLSAAKLWAKEVHETLGQDDSTPLRRETDGGTEASRLTEAFGEQLLVRVGRVVAQQRGGEIRDITSEDTMVSSEEGDFNGRSSDTEDNETEERDQGIDKSDTTIKDQVFDSHTVLSMKNGNFFEPNERGVDPGPGLAITLEDHVYARITCRRVVAEGVIVGRLFLCSKHVVFEPLNVQETAHEDTTILPNTTNFDEPSLPRVFKTNHEETAPGLHRCWRWKYRHLVAVYLRRYRLRDSAIELFVRNGHTHFLDFPRTTKDRRNEFVNVLYSFLPRQTLKQWPGRVLPHLGATTKAWQSREMSNLEYLMALNTFAGRSFNDITQYPVFPWVLSNYDDPILDFNDVSNFRDLSKPMGALNANRLQEYWERYHSFEDPVIPKFLYGSHYSTCAGVVLYFLFRLEPFATLHQKMQGGTFDLPDRLFHSLKETWQMCQSHLSEVKELTPEFYASDGTFLRNSNTYELGKRHDHQVVHDVVLPPWASTPEEFIRLHRAALESDYVSRHLHLWIDLIFGAKQRGRASLDANNVFYYLTYYGVVDLDQINDPFLRESMELQIAHFGQCPMQLFQTCHPSRYGTSHSQTKVSVSVVEHSTTIVSNSDRTSSSGFQTIVPRSLSLSFHDLSVLAHEKRRQWTCQATVQSITCHSIRAIQILSDRVVSINEHGILEVFQWTLVPKDKTMHSRIVSIHHEPYEPVPCSPIQDEWHECPWLLELHRDESIKASIPCIPMYEHFIINGIHTSLKRSPLVISDNGRVVISGGARNGALHIRLVDLDTNHVIGKASVVGHTAAITCLSLTRRMSRTHELNTLLTLPDKDDEHVLVSGSEDGTVALWHLSRLERDGRSPLPRISSRPVHLFRGLTTSIVDCCVNTWLNLVVACTTRVGMALFLHDIGHVAFVLEPADVQGVFVRVCISKKGYVVTLTRLKHVLDANESTVCQVFNVSGVLLQSHHLRMEEVMEVDIDATGELLVLTLVPGIIRIYRLEDFVTVQEYVFSTSCMISATCLGPKEAVVLLAVGHEDGTLSMYLLPDASGSVSFVANVRRLFGVSSKLERVKGTVHQAQTLAMSTLGNAKAVTNTARDIAEEALGEAKGMMRDLFLYLQK